ncbi:HNH/ENDO VII family nuclease [Clostridium estertheticum]|uniref:HNH/ENDO VII family nuclease n=2 Tax=Clostridium estertheticum TaxID=238834 RepID=UPI002714788B|nr:HNH/ENDO VII family nuclease [Clostridium estertheticum]WLC82508.1 HNH/ENDO VII family nuclease [Clostridium estertheticum]
MFYFGRPSKTSYKLEDTSDYKACKDLKQYHESGGSEAGHDTDYFYYEIETREKYEVGANISFKNKDFYVNQYKAHALSDEVIYKYRLCRKNGVWQTKVINSLIGGASIEGKVLEVKGEKIKLHLNIDKSQNKDKASWFPYAPPTGNVMYSMPIVGTSASLYFPSETSEDPIVTGCVRKNGSSCTKTADTTKRYFGTEHGSEIEMVPGALNIKGGSKEPLSISFDDAVGVTIKSHKKLSLSAAGGIIMKTPQSVKLKAQSQILVAKTGTKSGFSMETDLHFLSNNVIKNGSDREAYPPFDDEPTVGKKPEPKQVKKAAVVKAKKKETKKAEKKKGFNWGKLAGNVLAAVAVVAVVAAVVAVVVFTGGTAIPAVAGALAAVGTTAGAAAGMAFAGGMIMGGIGVAGKAISDCASGAVSDMSSYMSVGARESFVGALSGAIFGPYGAFKSYKGMMALGGLTNGVESVIRQTLEGKGINFKTLLLDAGFGAATAGMFHGAGKLFQKASPFVKKAFNKIASNISENTRIAKIALKNMEKRPKSVVLASNFGNVDEALGRFAKEFKKVKSGGKAELDLINQYPNNNVFSKAVRFNAGEGGTGITYKAFQRNDIDWDMVRITGAKKGRNLTNSQASEKYGLAPILDSDGNVATLHHSQQQSVGPLFEASTRYHNISNAKKAPLHLYKGKLNPFNPMSEETRKAFQKVDSIEYWKTRGRDVGKGVK